MGNRAVIKTKDSKIGIYLHRHGSRFQIDGFLHYCKLCGFRKPEDDCYGWARLTQVIANYIGGDLSIGIDILENLDTENWDNGTYIIENWEIVGREYNGDHDERPTDKLSDEFGEFLIDINVKQPEEERFYL